MAISIMLGFPGFKSVIPNFINGDIDQPDPDFDSFKRIDFIDMQLMSEEDIIINLHLLSKASILIQSLLINDKKLAKLYELYSEELSQLIVNELIFLKWSTTELTYETVMALNWVNPKTLQTVNLDQSFDLCSVHVFLPNSLEGNMIFDRKNWYFLSLKN